LNHALAKLARTIDWGFLEERFGAVYTDGPGQPPLPTRLMAGLAILKHTFDLSDEACASAGWRTRTHRPGDAANAVLAAAGYNFSLLIRWLRLLLRQILRQLFDALKLNPA
jgi:hypothetical protein